MWIEPVGVRSDVPLPVHTQPRLPLVSGFVDDALRNMACIQVSTSLVNVTFRFLPRDVMHAPSVPSCGVRPSTPEIM